MADIVLVNPAFDTSYWGLEHALPLFGKRANVPPASLPLLAALTPSEHRVTLVDESVEELDFERLARADIVGITGMSVQRFRMHQILQQVKQRGGFAVVGDEQKDQLLRRYWRIPERQIETSVVLAEERWRGAHLE